MQTKTSRVTMFGSGVIAGLLLAMIGFSEFFAAPDTMLVSKVVPFTKTVTVTKHHTVTVVKEVPKIVERVRVVEKIKIVERKVSEPKLYRAVLIENGKVVKAWEIVKCDFQVIGATLTDKNGRTFEVMGNISVEPIE